MNKKELKVLAGRSIIESKLPVSTKKQLLSYVLKNSSTVQLESLILDQDILSHVTEDSKKIVHDRFTNYLEKFEKYIVHESAELMLDARELIVSMLEDSVPASDFKKVKDFVLTEASDYQVVSMILENKLPDEASNPEKEKVLFESLSSIFKMPVVPVFTEGVLLEANGEGFFKRAAKYDVGAGAKRAYQGAKAASKEYTPTFYSAAHGAKTVAKVGAYALGALMVYRIGRRVYQKHFSAAARACGGAAEGKTQCMRNAKAKAIDAQISSIRQHLSACNQTSNPDKCRKQISKEIQRLLAQRQRVITKG